MGASTGDDFYVLLGVGEGAGDAELRRAWRELAARWHPDRAGVGATGTFQRISAAYAVLSDPVARAAYDRRRGVAMARSGGVKAGGGTAPPGGAGRRETPAVMLSRLTGALRSVLARGGARLDEPGFITLVLREAEAAQGGMVMVSMPVELWCPACGGREGAAGCARCGGRRVVEELFSAWLAVPPGVTAGEVLVPSAELPGMVERVRFRIAMAGK